MPYIASFAAKSNPEIFWLDFHFKRQYWLESVLPEEMASKILEGLVLLCKERPMATSFTQWPPHDIKVANGQIYDFGVIRRYD